jgi:photosystem I subunit 3
MRIFLLVLGTLILMFFCPRLALSDVSGLVPCSDSFRFQKRLDQRLERFVTRLEKYDERAPTYIDLKSQIERTKSRFDAYSRRGLLCGEEGLPHLIVDGRWRYADEFILPGLVFLYISGWIGWAGRSYLQYLKNLDNSIECEYIIHVPTALCVMFSSAFWPFAAWKECVANEFVVLDSEITVSPR